MSSACVCHIEGDFCFYCEMYVPLEKKYEIAHSALERMDDRVRPMLPRSLMARITKSAIDEIATLSPKKNAMTTWTHDCREVNDLYGFQVVARGKSCPFCGKTEASQ